MASFSAVSFDYARQSSLSYDMYVLEFGLQSSPYTESAGSGATIISDSVPRRAEQFIYGIQQDSPMQFSITIGSDKEQSRADINRLLSWLLHPVPAKLHINQDDMRAFYYVGSFTNPQLVSIGKRAFGMQLTFMSTSPYAWTYSQPKKYNITEPTEIIINNIGDSLDYLYPSIIFQPTNITQILNITNFSDNDRQLIMEFQPAPNGTEIVTIDNKNQIVTSTMGNDFDRHRFSLFNMKWLRLIRGVNKLNIIGNGLLNIDCIFPVRIGN